MLGIRPMLRLMTLCVATTVISGCVSTQGPRAVRDTSCTAFQVIRPSRQDTLETKRQVLAHNTIYRKLCGGKS